MAKDFSRPFYHSAQWQRARANAWARDHGLCQRCLERGHITPADVVHHIEELTPENVSDPRISSDPDNLVCLCHECHSAVHGGFGFKRKPATRAGMAFDAEGNLIRVDID